MSKSLRQFKCRDDLWSRVEALAKRRGISVDDVVQAALVQLFKKRPSSGQRTGVPSPSAGSTPAPSRMQTPAPAPAPAAPRAPARSTGASTPLPRPGGARLPPPSSVSRLPAKPPPLYLYYDGQCYAIDQEQFVIGRGSKYSDLAIKDANISRRHCAVVRRNSDYFIKDLESTNGIEFNGQRVDDHKIDEGSTYYLCDHELRFSFVPPA